eukprot:GHRR01030871.1.p1 GENE.GHRR01030871.1~~GHRR01030871.1.p1  ORF type:complete len:146 (+),score=50.79 GHRR01030871.1:313-750(+)
MNNGQANATVKFNLCYNDDEAPYATISNISPAPQALLLDGTPVVENNSSSSMLFQPAVQVWGSLTKSMYPDAATPDQVPYVNKYYIVPASSGDSFNFSLTDQPLLEGYYNLSAKVSVLSKYPQLVDLQGKSLVNQSDVEGMHGVG